LSEEKRIQNKAIEHAKGRGIRTIRLALQPGVARGWPDVLFLIPGGRPLFIEFKAPGKRPSEVQKLRIAQLKEDGYAVAVSDNLDHACSIIDQQIQHAEARGDAPGMDTVEVPSAGRRFPTRKLLGRAVP